MELEITPSFREDLEFIIARRPITTTDEELAVARLRAQLTNVHVEKEDLTMLRLERATCLALESTITKQIDELSKSRVDIERKRHYLESLILEAVAKAKSS